MSRALELLNQLRARQGATGAPAPVVVAPAGGQGEAAAGASPGTEQDPGRSPALTMESASTVHAPELADNPQGTKRPEARPNEGDAEQERRRRGVRVPSAPSAAHRVARWVTIRPLFFEPDVSIPSGTECWEIAEAGLHPETRRSWRAYAKHDRYRRHKPIVVELAGGARYLIPGEHVEEG